MDADGSNHLRLTRDRGKHSHPSWSPNSTRLAYASTLTSHNQIWRVRADGLGARNLSDNARLETTPTWS